MYKAIACGAIVLAGQAEASRLQSAAQADAWSQAMADAEAQAEAEFVFKMVKSTGVTYMDKYLAALANYNAPKYTGPVRFRFKPKTTTPVITSTYEPPGSDISSWF